MARRAKRRRTGRRSENKARLTPEARRNLARIAAMLPPHGVDWGRAVAACADAGIAPETFWRCTPRELQLELRAVVARHPRLRPAAREAWRLILPGLSESPQEQRPRGRRPVLSESEFRTHLEEHPARAGWGSDGQRARLLSTDGRVVTADAIRRLRTKYGIPPTSAK